MPKPMAQMTEQEIRQRLTELENLQRDHEARDLDAELAQTLRDGGDVDALETAHLEAERAARRLRVEISALTSELPNAIKREGELKLQEYAGRHSELAKDAGKRVRAIISAWAALEGELKAFSELQEDAAGLTRRAASIATSSGAEMPIMGTFQSARLIDAIPNLRDAWRLLSSADSPMTTQAGLQGRRID